MVDFVGRRRELDILQQELSRVRNAGRNDDNLPSAAAIGGYWTRTNDVEIDIVGADVEPVARQLLFVGSIKWLERSAFDDHDLAALLRHRALLTDELIPVVAISRAGTSCNGLDASYGPDELIESWALRQV